MKQRTISRMLMPLALLALPVLAADDDDPKSSREALQALNDFIGDWKLNGAPAGGARPGSSVGWSETISWTWRFKGDDAWLTMKIKNGKYFQGGDLRYLGDKKVYQLTLLDNAAKKLVFDGEIKNDVLTLHRVDPATKYVHRLTMNNAGDGVRFIYHMSHNRGGKSLFVHDFEAAGAKEGESLGAKEKKNICIVSGGLGVLPVSYKGQTYYVCCTGCRDAFNENPEKFVKEFNAKKR